MRPYARSAVVESAGSGWAGCWAVRAKQGRRPGVSRRCRALDLAVYGSIWLQRFGLKMRWVDGGFFLSFAGGRIGRGAKFPPQFGQTPPSLFSTQSRQKVHSNVHIIASVAEGSNSLSQHSQLGRNSSICYPYPIVARHAQLRGSPRTVQQIVS
jgi:hypothetical protein